ncbi:hypothetical protein CBS101457_000912 [Exobasidium rhododendri]|nr:hypothetical protein CBS101457_000912 [Exobasidium rhododendri]
MGKHYCDYCDVYLTHDSTSVRKDHNTGRNHLQNVRDYYLSLDPAQNEAIFGEVLQDYDMRKLPHPVFIYQPPGQGFGGGGFRGGGGGGFRPPSFGRPPFQQGGGFQGGFNRPPAFGRPPPFQQQQGPPTGMYNRPPPNMMNGGPPPPSGGPVPLGMRGPNNFGVPPPGYGPPR